MIKLQKILISIFIILSISACSLSSPRGYYSQLQLSPNIYRIEILGKQSTPYQTVKDFALLRAAEITLEKRKQRFIIVADNIVKTSKQVISTPYLIGSHVVNGISEPIYSTPEMKNITKTKGTMTIELISKNDNRYKSAYDAKIISAQLTPIFRANKEQEDWLEK